MNFPARMDGRIVVTNKRVMLYGSDRSLFGTSSSNWVNDIHIEKVKGTDVFVSRKINIGAIIAGIVLIVLGIVFALIIPIFFILSLIFIIGGIILILSSISRSFWVTIKAEHIPGIEIGGMRKGLQIMGIKAGPHAVLLAQEIGAIILNVQNNPKYKPERIIEHEVPPPPPMQQDYGYDNHPPRQDYGYDRPPPRQDDSYDEPPPPPRQVRDQDEPPPDDDEEISKKEASSAKSINCKNCDEEIEIPRSKKRKIKIKCSNCGEKREIFNPLYSGDEEIEDE